MWERKAMAAITRVDYTKLASQGAQMFVERGLEVARTSRKEDRSSFAMIACTADVGWKPSTKSALRDLPSHGSPYDSGSAKIRRKRFQEEKMKIVASGCASMNAFAPSRSKGFHAS